MPDRFRKFTDDELEALRIGIDAEEDLASEWGGNGHPLLYDMRSEIEHEQTQRKHAAARQLAPA